MAGKVKGILLREETVEAMLALSDEQRGKLILALFADSGMCDAPELDVMTRMAFICLVPGVRRAQDDAGRRYDANVANGHKGGRPKKSAADEKQPENPLQIGFDATEAKPTGFDKTESETPKPMGFGKTDGVATNQNQTNPNQTKKTTDPPTLSSERVPPAGGEVPAHAVTRSAIDRGRARCGEVPAHAVTRRASTPPVSRKPPTVEEVQAYCDARNNGISAERFCDYYAAQGWRLSNGQPLRDWKAAVRNWEGRTAERSAYAAGRPMPGAGMTDAERRDAHNRAVLQQVAADLDAAGSPF